MNKTLKTALTVFVIFTNSVIEYGCVNAVIDGLKGVKFWVAMLFDSFSLTFALICLGLFSKLPFQTAQILGSLPFLLMIFLSTTFSPGAGVPGLKELRYVYARFYFWCMVPGVEDQMEGCPPSNVNILYLILSALVPLVVFLIIMGFAKLRKSKAHGKEEKKRAKLQDAEFRELQLELYGSRALRRFKGNMSMSMHSSRSDKSVGSQEEDQPKVEQVQDGVPSQV
jgi:hypothetical protein